MHRPAWSVMIGSRARPAVPGYTSFQSLTLSSTGRRSATWRGVLMKPLGSAIERLHHPARGLVLGEAVLLGLHLRGENPLVVGRHHLGEAVHGRVPVLQKRPGDRGAGLLVVPSHDPLQLACRLVAD